MSSANTAAGSVIQVAALCPETGALGPGRRSVLWVQGCPLSCSGCVAPEWIPSEGGWSATSHELAERLLVSAAVTGLTLSGGEPMVQAAGLAELVRAARHRRPGIDVICFSGFPLDRLRSRPPGPGVSDLLAEIDVLIDGPYVAARDDGVGLRGSANQRVHHLSDRLVGSGYDFNARVRDVEIQVGSREALLVGVPTAGVVTAFDRLTRAREPGTVHDDARAGSR